MKLVKLLMLCPLYVSLAACAAQAPVRPFAKFRQYAPANVAEAQFPLISGGSEAYQDHGGQAMALGSSPALNDTGSERIPDFPAGAEQPIVEGRSEVIMPNGGETIVQSVNSLP